MHLLFTQVYLLFDRSSSGQYATATHQILYPNDYLAKFWYWSFNGKIHLVRNYLFGCLISSTDVLRYIYIYIYIYIYMKKYYLETWSWCDNCFTSCDSNFRLSSPISCHHAWFCIQYIYIYIYIYIIYNTLRTLLVCAAHRPTKCNVCLMQQAVSRIQIWIRARMPGYSLN